MKTKRRIEELDVEVTTYSSEMIDMMHEFVEKLNMKHWFPEGWEIDFGKGNHLVALSDSKIVDWCEYSPNFPLSEFGEIGVLENYRNSGIGTCLLLESM